MAHHLGTNQSVFDVVGDMPSNETNMKTLHKILAKHSKRGMEL
jgi:hypothetical protein